MSDTKDYKFYINQGIDLTNKGEFDDALVAFDKAIELNSNAELAYFSKGIAYHNLNQLQAAYESYSKAIELNPKMIDAYFNRAQSILAFDNPDEAELEKALSDLKKAIELDGNFLDAYYYAAVVMKKLGKYDDAVKYLDIVIAKDPMAVYSKALKKLILQKYLNR